MNTYYIVNADDELYHHGILGQHWGIRRYQNKDGTLTPEGRRRYLMADGSLSEEGKEHRENFVNRMTEKNERYYAKYEKKYQKAIDSNSDNPEKKKYYEECLADARKSKAALNDAIKKMSIEDISKFEREETDAKIKTASRIAGTTAVAVLGSAVPSVIGVGAGSAIGALSKISADTITATAEKIAFSQAGQNVLSYAEAGIRLYSDAHAYVFGIMADEALNRLSQMGVAEKAGRVAGQAAKAFISNAGLQTGVGVNSAISSIASPQNIIALSNASFQVGEALKYIK